MTRTAVALILCFSALSRQAAPAAQPASLQSQLQAKFEELHKAASFPGGTAAFVLADGSSFAIAVGVSDRATKTPMKITDRLLLGSVGKTYVSAVALQMIDEGKFALEDTLDKFFAKDPWFPRLVHAEKITVRHLMTHTSGLVRYELNPRFTKDLSANPDKVWSGEDRLAYLFDAKPPFEPGLGWEYSDTNFIVLGMIIERVGATPYYEQLRKRILEPLGLKDTVPADSRTVPGLIQGYAGASNPFGGSDEMIKDGKFAVNPQFEWTGGGLAVTSLDLARWGKLLYEGKAIPSAMMPKLLEGVPARLGPEAKYGLGVIIRPSPLGITYGHSGFMPGYQTELVYFPEMKTSIAVQVNSSAPRSTGRSLRAYAIEFAQLIAAGRGAPRAAEAQTSTPAPLQNGENVRVCGMVTSYATSPRCDVTFILNESLTSRRISVLVPAGAQPDFARRYWQLAGAEICASGPARVFAERTFVSVRSAENLEMARAGPHAAFAADARPSCGAGLIAPEVISRKNPDYTPETMRSGIQGVVEMEAVVEATGLVGNVRVRKSLHPQLDAAATDALKEWRFKPGTNDGVPVPVLVHIEMTFTLRKAP